MRDQRAIWGRLPWWSKGLNALTGGIQEGELTYLIARPSVGKTTLMVQQTDAAAEALQEWEAKERFPGAVIKLVLCESSAETFEGRWACLRSGVSQRKVKEGTITQEQYERYVESLRDIARMPIQYLEHPSSLDEISAFLRTGKPTYWWSLDHIHRAPLSATRPNDGGVQALTLISRELANLAETVAPGMVLAHVSREVDKRDDKRPRMSDLKGASSLEGDARVVLGLYREDIYLKIPEEDRNKPRVAELILAKQNEGESNRTIDLIWRPGKWFEDTSDLMLAEEA
jgi:replicative DNA helicase